MAQAVAQNNFPLLSSPASGFSASVGLEDLRNQEYAQTMVSRLAELRGAVSNLDDELIRDSINGSNINRHEPRHERGSTEIGGL